MGREKKKTQASQGLEEASDTGRKGQAEWEGSCPTGARARLPGVLTNCEPQRVGHHLNTGQSGTSLG